MNIVSTVIIGSDQRRAAIKRVLRGVRNVRIGGEIGDADALRLVALVAPDVVILDGASTTVNPLLLLPALLHLRNEPQIIALATTDSVAERRLLLELGAIATARLEQPETLPRALAVSARVLELSGSAWRGDNLLHLPDRRAAIEAMRERAA